MSNRRKAKQNQKNIKNKIPKVKTRPKSEQDISQLSLNQQSNLEYSTYNMLNMLNGLGSNSAKSLNTQSIYSIHTLGDMEDLMDSLAFIEYYTFRNVRLHERYISFTYNSIIKDIKIFSIIEIRGNDTIITLNIPEDELGKIFITYPQDQTYNDIRLILYQYVSEIASKAQFSVIYDNKTKSITLSEKLYASRLYDGLASILSQIITTTDSLLVHLDTHFTDTYYWIEYTGYNHLGKYIKNTCICNNENDYSIYRDNYIEYTNPNYDIICNITPNVITALKAIGKVYIPTSNIKLTLEGNTIRLYKESSGELYINGIQSEYSSFEIDTIIGELDNTTNNIIPTEKGTSEYNNFCLVQVLNT